MPTPIAIRSARKNICLIVERLELQRIATGIVKKERRLFAGHAFKADAGFYDERNISFLKSCRKLAPFVHGKNCTEMTHWHVLAVNNIMFFVSCLIRA